MSSPTKNTIDPMFFSTIEDQVRMAKFFTKLVDEVKILKADSIKFSLGSSELKISIVQKSSELKNVSIKPAWFKTIEAWLNNRKSTLWHNKLDNNDDIIQIKTGVDFVSFNYIASSGYILIENINIISQDKLITKIDCNTKCLDTVKDILHFSHGLIICCSNNNINLNKSINFWLSNTSASFLGSIEENNNRFTNFDIANKELVLMATEGKSFEHGLNQIALLLNKCNKHIPIWVVESGFVQEICHECPDNMRISANKLAEDRKALEENFKAISKSKVGCPDCNYSGYFGERFIARTITISDELRILIANNLSIKSINEYLNTNGIKSLADLATESVCRNKTDLNAIIESGLSENVKTEIIEVDDNFFVANTNSVENLKNTFIVRSLDTKNQNEYSLKNNLSILIVEDNTDQREILELSLTKMGYSVTSAENGLEALGFLQAKKPDLIITDLMMPKMNGVELVKNIKANPNFSELPIMVLTVISDADKEYELLDLGVEDYCEKTTPTKVLNKRIENLLRRKQISKLHISNNI
jgi:CheY-like chemotaxis protein